MEEILFKILVGTIGTIAISIIIGSNIITLKMIWELFKATWKDLEE